MTISGRLGGRFVLEASVDLRTWVPLATLINTDGQTTFTDPGQGEFNHRFYRVRLLD